MIKKLVWGIVSLIAIVTIISFLFPPENQSTQTDENQFALTDIGKNEDPSIMIDNNGVPHLAWFSDRSGNADIWITTLEEENWSEPVQITDDPRNEFYPTLIQSSDDVFHLVWFKAGTSFDIWYSNSLDGKEWSEPLQLTDDQVIDWTPTITEKDNDIFITWASTKTGNKDIFVMKLGDTPIQMTNNANADDFPFIFLKDEKLAMVWNTYDGPGIDPFTNTGSKIVYSTSEDGIDWTDPITLVGYTDKTNILPAVYQRNGEYFLTWTSNNDDVFGDIVTAPLLEPENIQRLTSNLYPDYSGRIADDILVWVADPQRNNQDLHIFYKIIE